MFPPEQPSSQPRHNSLALVLILIVTIAVSAVGFLFWQRQQDQLTQDKLQTEITQLNQQLVEVQATPEPLVHYTPAPLIIASPSPQGTIQGQLSFPSEFLPKQRICAVDVNTTTELCTETYEGNTYTLSVPAGTYHVYAMVLPTPDTPSIGKAYYSEFVTCGLLATCPSHEPINVTVEAGETTTNVNPGDWYNQ